MYDLSKEHSEKIIIRMKDRLLSIAPDFLETGEEDKWTLPNETSTSATFEDVRVLYRDLTQLGLGLAFKYKSEEEYRNAITVLAKENVRLMEMIEEAAVVPAVEVTTNED